MTKSKSTVNWTFFKGPCQNQDANHNQTKMSKSRFEWDVNQMMMSESEFKSDVAIQFVTPIQISLIETFSISSFSIQTMSGGGHPLYCKLICR